LALLLLLLLLQLSSWATLLVAAALQRVRWAL
jgi:hypothetical protein